MQGQRVLMHPKKLATAQTRCPICPPQGRAVRSGDTGIQAMPWLPQYMAALGVRPQGRVQVGAQRLP